MKIPNLDYREVKGSISLARIVSEDSQHRATDAAQSGKSSKDS